MVVLLFNCCGRLNNLYDCNHCMFILYDVINHSSVNTIHSVIMILVITIIIVIMVKSGIGARPFKLRCIALK